MVYGHVDGNEIWYIRGEKKTLDCRAVGYTDADNEVVIYLDHNDQFEKVISRSKLETQQGRDIAGVLISWSLGTVLLICAIRYCENKYCWQFKLFWKWYDRFIPVSYTHLFYGAIAVVCVPVAGGTAWILFRRKKKVLKK